MTDPWLRVALCSGPDDDFTSDPWVVLEDARVIYENEDGTWRESHSTSRRSPRAQRRGVAA